MSHELRTPLNAIIGFAEIIAGRLFGPNDPRYFDYAGDIHTSGKHLLELINDILDLSKIVAGRLELVESELELAPLYAGLAKMFVANADKAAISIVVEMAEPQLSVRADSMRVQQILMNLLSNAIKFTPPGGQVRLFARRSLDSVCLGVSDTGVGMTPEEARLAVEPFTQVDSRLSRSHEGTGLGLAICKELASLHQGMLTIDSEKGKGTTVTLCLPLGRLL
jgi:signal transduction histidine kinase